ncbi:hypothetical protein LFAB_16865 [Lactiplantibacillus fabifermentans T30PCM01]|uniref:HTH tetR-type domain-containing protein n=1 Tax=Lactiplantibacillus fabifermentans T30PCM01 TaxID=1400520 RepID=W6T3V6_9LACO|nr:TetR/AcrR family transcriptional regulator [Lactiplantibacillus fabifermentans]ETY72606.1 hypothetical protein LFAB_16865 [Lactiplantibacillus fabifermentans T30PCM01]
MGYTHKTAHTRQILMGSLLTNLKTKAFTDVTVNDIVTPLYLDRSTFYRYFDDKYDLLTAIEDEVLSQMTALNGDLPHFEMLNNEMLETVAGFFQQQAPTLAVLLGEHGTPTFEHKLKQNMIDRFHQVFVPVSRTNPEINIMSDLLITMVVHAFKTWVLQPQAMSMTETLTVLRTVIDEGLVPTIQRYESD